MKRKSGLTGAATASSGGGVVTHTTVPTNPSAAANAPAPVAPPAAKKRRVTQPVGNLTNAQKRALCVKFAQVKMTQQELCAWAKSEFALLNLPHQSTISKILARAGELTSMPAKALAARRRGLVTHPELDTALCNWVLFARQNNVKLSGDLIKDRARQLAVQLGLASTMTFSNGWLGGFKKRHNIRLGGSGATPMANSSAAAVSGMLLPTNTTTSAVEEPAFASEAVFGGPLSPALPAAALATPTPFAIRELQDCARLYHASDVFTMSETGLFYALSPEKPAVSSASGRSSSAGRLTDSKATTRRRLTVAFAANADGSERLEPFFIGAAKLPPRLLQAGLDDEDESTTAAAGQLFQYRDNRKAWMTPVLFQEWLGLLDTKLRDDQRSILLLLAHAPSHIRIGLELTNIRLEMLPPSTTSQYQPFEAGIASAFKRRYRRHHLHHALDRFEAGLQDDIFAVDLVQALRWVRECWFSVPQSVLRHYWDTTEITSAPRPSPQASHAIEDAELAIESEICDAVSALPVARPMTIEEFLSPGDENVALHCLGTDELDFIHSVGESSESAAGFDAEKLASELRFLGAGANPAIGEAARMGAAATATGHVGPHTTSEQLLACFKMLLPELDRLRFDEHTKNSIRLAFRRLKEKESEQVVDAKQRQAVRKAMMAGQTQHLAAAESPVTMSAAITVPGAQLPAKPDDAENTVV